MMSEQRRLVLIVDTDERFIDEARSLLAEERIITARTLDEAVEITLGGRVDLVLLGPAFGSEIALVQAQRLLEADASAEVAVVADSATNRLLKAALKGGFTDVLPTPLSADDLAEVLRSVSPPATDPSAVQVFMEPSAAEPLLPIVVDSAPTDSTGPPEASGSVGTVADMTFAPAEPRLAAPTESSPQAIGSASSIVTAPVVPDSSVGPDGAPRRSRPPSTEPTEPESSRPVPAPALTPEMPTFAPPPAPPAASIQVEAPGAGDAALPPPPSSPPPGALADAAAPARARPGGGQVIAVMAGKGGSGKSVVATNLAIALGMRGDPERIAIVDADLQFGDVALLLQLDPVRTLDDVLGVVDEMSDERLEAALLRHESGVRVLPAPLLPVRAGEIDAKDIVAVVERLRSMYDAVIVDTGPVFDDGLITILDHADQVITVVDMDLPSVKNAKIALDGLRQVGFDTNRIRLVVNRANSKARLDLVELERSLGLRVGGSIPSDRLIPQSVNEGIPVLALSPRSKAARAFYALAESVAPTATRERLATR